MRDRFFGGGLSRRARDRDQRLSPELAHRRGQSLKRGQGVIDCKQSRVAAIAGQITSTHHGSRSAFLQRLLDKIVTVQPFPFHRKEKLTGLYRPRVDGVSPGNIISLVLARGCNELADSRQWQSHVRVSAAALAASQSNPASRNASRATSTSSKGHDPSRVTCIFSCPLPASRTMSPGRASPIASAMAFLRSVSTAYFALVFCKPTRASLMMEHGSSLRGLSEVSTTKSLPRPATSPMSGRFVRSRSPPQPKSVTTRPFDPFCETNSRASAVRLRSASSVCA